MSTPGDLPAQLPPPAVSRSQSTPMAGDHRRPDCAADGAGQRNGAAQQQRVTMFWASSGLTWSKKLPAAKTAGATTAWPRVPAHLHYSANDRPNGAYHAWWRKPRSISSSSPTASSDSAPRPRRPAACSADAPCSTLRALVAGPWPTICPGQLAATRFTHRSYKRPLRRFQPGL